MENTKLRGLTHISIFAALTAVASQIVLPLPFSPVPINLAFLPIIVGGGLLGWRKAVASQLVYLLVGAVGVPVFAGFRGGLSALTGPTGGYLAGYLLLALCSGIIPHLSRPTKLKSSLLIAVGIVACYLLGTFWFMFITDSGFLSALALCVLPFIPGDLLKLVAGMAVIDKLKKAVMF